MTPAVPQTEPYEFLEWLTPEAKLTYRDYWENEATERTKPYWILDGNFERLERYLESAGRVRQIETIVAYLGQRLGRRIQGTGCELGSGAAWSVPHLLRLGDVDRIYCVEYSRQRLFGIAPALLRHYGVSPGKVVLALGDFNSVRLPDLSMDFVFMCATFHHSDDPRGLLREVRRLLQPEGFAIVAGEHEVRITWRNYLKQPAKWIVSRTLPKSLQRSVFGHEIRARRLLPSMDEMLQADEELGDHYYAPDEYRAIFTGAGFEYMCVADPRSHEQSFILFPVT